MKVFNPLKCRSLFMRLEVEFFSATFIPIYHGFGKLPLAEVFVVNSFNGAPLYNEILYNIGKYGDIIPTSSTPELLSFTDYVRVDPDFNSTMITLPNPLTGRVVLLA